MTALAPLATLSRRRFQLTAHTPRELVVPLVTPMLFALVIAPALKEGLLGDASGLEHIWRMGNDTVMAGLSLGVVAVFAAALTAVSIRVFSKAALR